MNEQILLRLRDVLRRNGLSQEQSSSLILLLLVWLRQADVFAHISVHLSPQQIIDRLKDLVSGRPVLVREFIDSGLLQQLNPVDLLQVVDLTNQLLGTSSDKAPALDAVALPSVLGVNFACDPSLPRLISRLVQPADGELVYVPWDSTGQFSAALADLGARIVIETPVQPVVAMLMGMLHRGHWQVDQVNPILGQGTAGMPTAEQSYDSAATFLPLGMRIDLQLLELASPGRFPERTTSAAVLGIRQLLAVTKQRIVVAVQNNVLFSSGAEYNLREELLQRGLLRAVIAMPSGLLHGPQVAFSILVIEPTGGADRVSFINADSPRFKAPSSQTRTTLVNLDRLVQLSAGEIDDPDVAVVSTKALLNKDKDAQLQVNRYVLPDTIARARAILASTKTVALEDLVALIRPPLIVSDRDQPIDSDPADEALPVFEVGAADLPALAYVTKPGRRVKLDPRARADAEVLCPNDIVLIVKGSVGKIGIASGDVEPDEACVWIAGQSAIVLRVRDPSRIDPRALFMQLRSPLGQQLLKGIVSGATIPLIQLKELRKLPVILQDAATQQQAIAALEAEAALERQITQLRNEQALKASSLWQLD